MIKFLKLYFARQYGDHFMFQTICPECQVAIFQPFPFRKCECGLELLEYRAEVDKSFNFKVVCGTKRKKNIGKRTIQQLLKLQDGNCAYCDIELSADFHVEHIMPLCCGGTNNYNNLALSCPRCNLLAGRKWFHSFYDKKIYILNAIKNKNRR